MTPPPPSRRAPAEGSPNRLQSVPFRVFYAALVVLTPWLFWPAVGGWFVSLGHWWLCILLRAFGVSFLFCPVSIALARRWGVLDQPDPRKLHAAPMPRLGGLAVLAGIAATTSRYVGESSPLAALLAGGVAMYALAVADDARPLSAGFRLLVQAGVCVAVMASGVVLNTVPDAVPGQLWLNGALTALWIIGLVNAVNFLDGIDGLAASLGLLCACLFLAVGWETRQSHLAVLTASLAGACLGFIPYNWHRSTTFLGDGGATLIGFLLAGVAVWGSWSSGDPLVSFSTPLLILSIPIFDMIYITISRIKNSQVRSVKEWLEYVGKDHLHHRLMKLGMSQPQAVAFVLTVNLALGLAALVIRSTGSALGAWLLVAQSVLIFMVIVALMLLGRERTD